MKDFKKPIRQQVELEVAGTTYRVVPDFTTLDMMEEKLSTTLFFQRLRVKDIRVSELAWAIYSALVCQGIADVEYGEIGEAIIHDGLPKHIEQVTELVGAIINVGPERPLPNQGGGGKGKGKASKKPASSKTPTA